MNNDEEDKEYSDGFVCTKHNDSISFYMDGYNKPSNKYQILLSLQLIVHSFELLLKDIIVDKLGYEKVILKGEKSINFAQSIDLYNSIAHIKLDKEQLLKIKKERNCLEHFSLKTSYEKILEIIKYLFCEIWILYKAEYKKNLIDYFEFDMWKNKTVSFYEIFSDLIKNSDRVRDNILSLVLPNDSFICMNCGYNSVQKISMKCSICNEEMDFLLD
jgi:hypothetical protein